MQSKLNEHGYEIIRNFITSEKAEKLALNISEQVKSNIDVMRDGQVPDADSLYNSKYGLELLVNKNGEISSLINESLLPTYCYSRIYKNGCELIKHVDRQECEVSLTVHLDGDEKWDFYVENYEKEEVCITLNKGDAIIYLGAKVPHWRNKYIGKSYTQLFLHYVRSDGEYADRYFDNAKRKEQYDNVEDYIVYEQNFLDHDICDELISEFHESEWQNTRISGGSDSQGSVLEDVRNCKSIEFSYSDVMGKNYEARNKLDSIIFNKISEAYSNYASTVKNSQITCEEDEGYTLLKYDVGGKYVQHTDHYQGRPRSLTIIINLNDDYTGGELAFRNRTKIYNLQKGDIIIFPSNFMYPHEIIPVKSGTRYALITWMI